MKKFLVLLSILFSSFTYADTINLHWLNEDGTIYQNSTCTVDNDLIVPTTPPTKYGYTFSGWEPASYIPIEYIESTGTQYIVPIKTSVKNLKVDISFSVSNSSPNDGSAIFGSGDSSGNTPARFQMILLKGDGTCQYGMGGGFIDKTCNNLQYNVQHNIIADSQTHSFNVDGDIFYVGTNATYDDDVNQYLFSSAKFADPDVPLWLSMIKIYKAKYYKDSTLVRDMIPVLDQNGTPCLFDRVTGQFFYNQGTGDFIAGPVLTE